MCRIIVYCYVAVLEACNLTWRAGHACLCDLTPPGSRPAQLLEKSEDEDKEHRQNEVFWKIDLGATDKDLKDAPLDRGAGLA